MKKLGQPPLILGVYSSGPPTGHDDEIKSVTISGDMLKGAPISRGLVIGLNKVSLLRDWLESHLPGLPG